MPVYWIAPCYHSDEFQEDVRRSQGAGSWYNRGITPTMSEPSFRRRECFALTVRMNGSEGLYFLTRRPALHEGLFHVHFHHLLSLDNRLAALIAVITTAVGLSPRDVVSIKHDSTGTSCRSGRLPLAAAIRYTACQATNGSAVSIKIGFRPEEPDGRGVVGIAGEEQAIATVEERDGVRRVAGC